VTRAVHRDPLMPKPRTNLLHDGFARQIVLQILNETKATRGSYSDLVEICESVLVALSTNPQVQPGRQGS
jgi:hypothetical protein